MKMQVTFLAFMLYFKSASRLPRKQNFLRWNPLNIINVESPFQMGNWEAVADVDVVHDGPIPSQTIHLDFGPI
jgi:PhoPQ-activated pathogenicity-related protein